MARFGKFSSYTGLRRGLLGVALVGFVALGLAASAGRRPGCSATIPQVRAAIRAASVAGSNRPDRYTGRTRSLAFCLRVWGAFEGATLCRVDVTV